MSAKSLIVNIAESNNLVQNIAEPIFIDNIVTALVVTDSSYSHQVDSVKDKHIAKMYRHDQKLILHL